MSKKSAPPPLKNRAIAQFLILSAVLIVGGFLFIQRHAAMQSQANHNALVSFTSDGNVQSDGANLQSVTVSITGLQSQTATTKAILTAPQAVGAWSSNGPYGTYTDAIAAAPGDLDSTFGSNGQVFISSHTYARGLAIQNDGKIVSADIAGYLTPNTDIAVARYNLNGSLDNSFGTGGKIVINLPQTKEEVGGVIIQPDGKIIIAGSSGASDSAMAFIVFRLNSNGTLDTTFNSTGSVTTSLGTRGEDVINDVILQSDGKILVVGYSFNLSKYFALVRYNSDGTLDQTFGTGGKVITQGRNEFNDTIANTVKLQADGKIVAAGYSGNPASSGVYKDLTVFRYNSNGTLDNTFGTGGKVFTTPVFGEFSNYSKLYDLAVQPDGKLVAGGTSGGGSEQSDPAILIRYNQDGSLDTSFGNSGSVILESADSLKGGRAVALQSNGKIIIGGGYFNANAQKSDFAATRLNANGTIDRTFGTNGRVVTQLSSPYSFSGSYITNILVQPDGKIVASGNARNGSLFDSAYNVAVVRYMGDSVIISNRQFDFDGDSKADVSVFRPSNGTWYVSKSSDGTSTGAQWGLGTDKIVPADYDGDGKADYTVFRDGFWYLIKSSTNTFDGYQWGASGDIPQPFDYDGDGKADITVFRNGIWYVLKSSGGVTTTQWGTAGDVAVAADYDGDGKADYAIFRNGVWWILKSGGGTSVVQWGTGTDKAVPADYDGDGKADLVVFRNGFWYFLNSQTGFQGSQWGSPGDIPAPADYDGDGKTDIAVFRNGTWYIQRTTAGVQVVNFGTTGDKPVPNSFVY